MQKPTEQNGTKRVLFGAGGAGVNYIKSLEASDLPDAIVDNDPNKWGNTVRGISVTNPSIIDWPSVKQIWVASIGLREIECQLEALGADVSKISTPPKSSFGGGILATRTNRKSALRQLAGIMARYADEPIVAVYGAALGLMRDGDLIPWDADIDLVAPLALRTKLVADLSQSFEFAESSDFADTVLVPLPDGLRIPFTFEYVDYERPTFMQGIFGCVWEWSTSRFRFPAQVQIPDGVVFVPDAPKDYLARVYGPTWQTPDKSFTANDYAQ